VTRDAEREGSKHDMGGDIVPDFVGRGEGYVYDFKDNPIPGSLERDKGYWRDVGTIDSYYEAQMELVSIHPVFNLYNYEWPIFTDYGPYPPAKFVRGSKETKGEAHNTAVSPGVVVSGACVTDSVLSPRCHIHSFAVISDSVLLDGVDVGRNAIVKRAILDKNVRVPEGVSIGVDREADLARGFHVTDSGITVVGKGMEIKA
jgi:glucose-1-phosphate adenylyltransferase